jgi:anti-sigma B factor antagonist
MRGFRVTTTQTEPGRAVLALVGEVDLSSAPEFAAELNRAVDGGARLLVIDLLATTFIDSTALRVLLQGQKRLQSLGGRMCLVCSDRSIWKIFAITGLDEVFPRYPTVSKALAWETEEDAVVDDAGREASAAPTIATGPAS